jgi:hypothetical protein
MPSIFLTSAGRGKRAVLWTVLLFAASQLALWAYLDCLLPEVRDPLYTLRLRSLQSRLSRSRGAPLVLLLGSSRVKYGLWPAAMPVRATKDAPPPVVYNFGFNGAGFIREWMYFRRLLADGVRPDWLILETWPPLWAEDGFFAESRMIVHEDELHLRDVPLLCRYFAREPAVCLGVARRCLTPIRSYRARLVQAAVASWLPRAAARQKASGPSDWEPADDSGWSPLTWGPTTPEQKQKALQDALDQMKPLTDPLRIDPRSDAALRELLAECRARGIKVALLMMPEHGVTRDWYPPQACALIRDYLGGISREFAAPVIDLRTWAADGDFADLCHLGRHGVEPISTRFGRDVLQPLLESRALPANVLLGARDFGQSAAQPGRAGLR